MKANLYIYKFTEKKVYTHGVESFFQIFIGGSEVRQSCRWNQLLKGLP